MTIQLYGSSKSAATRAAERFLKERRIDYQFVDVVQRPPGARELELFARQVGAEHLIDESAPVYRKRGMAYMEFDAFEEIAERPELLRVPILRAGRAVVVGDDPDGWARLTSEAAGG